MKIRRKPLFAALLFTTTCVYGAGTNVAEFLRLGTGARPAGMGEAYTAAGDDVYSVQYNPAGILGIQTSEAGFSHTEWFSGIKFQNLNYARRINEKAAVGLEMIYLGSGDISKTDIDVNEKIVNTGKSYAVSDYAFGLTYAGVVKGVTYGATAKIFQEAIEDESSYGVAADAGALFRPFKTKTLEALSLGVAVQNIGGQIKSFTDKKEALPLTAKLGAAYRFSVSDFVFNSALDINKSFNSDFGIHIGQEVNYRYLSFRLGFKSENTGVLKQGLTAGAGFKTLDKYIIDFAWVPYGLLGDTIRISLIYKFGPH